MLCVITKKLHFSLVVADFSPLEYKVKEQHYELLAKSVEYSQREQVKVEGQLEQLVDKTEEDYPLLEYQQVDSVIYLDKTQEDYVNIFQQIATHPLIAIDTEFTIYSASPVTRGVICLIQISTPQQNYILDIQELKKEKGFWDLVEALKEIVLENMGVRKVMHGCDNDIKYLN